jgi:hypothetical protein
MNIVPTYSNNTNEYRAKRLRKEFSENFPIKTIKASYSVVTEGSTVSVSTKKQMKENVDIDKMILITVEQKFTRLQETINLIKWKPIKK